VKILYVHPVGAFGGASKSLIELFRVLKSNSVEGAVLCPFGSVGAAFASAGLKVFQIKGIAQWDNTRYGYYRGFRWLILLREVMLFPFTWLGMRRLLQQKSYDIVHLNEITLLPWARLVRRWSDAKIVVHVRSLQRDNASDLRTRSINRALCNNVDMIVAIDETVRRSLPPGIPVFAVHNGLNIDHAPSQKCANPPNPRRKEKRFRIGIVGVLLKLKGIYEFLEAARILVNERQLEIEFYIVGENARHLSGWKGKLLKSLDLAHDVRSDIERVIVREQLLEHVHLTGFVSNVQEVYSKIDLLCFPSYLDAAGRPVFEAAFFGIPSIVAVKNPTADTIIDGETGICISHSDSGLLADAIEKLYFDRDELYRLGQNARELAYCNFDIKKNGAKLLALYRELLGKDDVSAQSIEESM